jgi:hypothetical protein
MTTKRSFSRRERDYGSYRKIKDIMAQARVEILIIDPYVDENLLDMCASLDASIKVRVLSEHLKGDFKVGYRKLQKQRGNIEVRTLSHFHDRFIVIDGGVCYQLVGPSITPAQRRRSSASSRTPYASASSPMPRRLGWLPCRSFKGTSSRWR